MIYVLARRNTEPTGEQKEFLVSSPAFMHLCDKRKIMTPILSQTLCLIRGGHNWTMSLPLERAQSESFRNEHK